MSLRVLTRFPYLERELSRIATHRIGRLHLEGPDGESTIIDSDGPAALMIRRVEFDALLVNLAVEAGVEVTSGVDIVGARQEADAVQLTARDGRPFSAPFVIAADGVNSVIARRLGLNRGWPAAAVALDMMEETARADLRDLDPATMWVSYGCNLGAAGPVKGRSAPEGYAYIFPKRDHVNIGVGYVLSHYRRAIGTPPYELQQRLVSRLREAGRVAGESVRRNFTPFLIPVAGPLAGRASGACCWRETPPASSTGLRPKGSITGWCPANWPDVRWRRLTAIRAGSFHDSGGRAIAKSERNCGIRYCCSAISSRIGAGLRGLSLARGMKRC